MGKPQGKERGKPGKGKDAGKGKDKDKGKSEEPPAAAPAFGAVPGVLGPAMVIPGHGAVSVQQALAAGLAPPSATSRPTWRTSRPTCRCTSPGPAAAR